jgi:hypothetical protein
MTATEGSRWLYTGAVTAPIDLPNRPNVLTARVLRRCTITASKGPAFYLQHQCTDDRTTYRQWSSADALLCRPPPRQRTLWGTPLLR